MNKHFNSRFAYMTANYAAYFLNFLSGMILARNLGPDGRGELAFLSSFYLITLLLTPMNSRNGSSLASIKDKTKIIQDNNFPFRKNYIVAALLSALCTLVYINLLSSKVDSKSLIYFAISNLACGLAYYLHFFEGIFKVEEKLFELAVLRFLGLAIPSIYVFILFFFRSLNIQLILLNQFLAVFSCFLFLKYRRKKQPKFSYGTYRTQVKKTYLSYILENMANILILVSITLTKNSEYIGHFAVAFSFILISETFYPLIESRMLNRILSTSIQQKPINMRPLTIAIKELTLSQAVFAPFSLLIPSIYGSAFDISVNFALVLILAKYNFSIVKLINSYAVISDRYDIPTFLNSFYIILYLLLFESIQRHYSQYSWEVSSICASGCSVFLGIIFLSKLKPERMGTLSKDYSSGAVNV
jgi:hypothetical protein